MVRFFGFAGEVGHEGVQAQWVGGLGQDGLHERARLVGEVVPVFDAESRRLEDAAQVVGADQMALCGLIGPWQGIVELALITNCDVPQGKPTALGQCAVSF